MKTPPRLAPQALREQQLDRAAAWFALSSLLPGLALPLFSTPLWAHGFSPQSEPVVIVAFAAAGLGALVLAGWLAAGGRPPRRDLLLAMPAFALAAWLQLSGPGGLLLADWRLHWLGEPGFGLGALWYAALGVWILLGGLVLRHAQARRCAIGGALAVSAIILVIRGIDLARDYDSLLLVKAFYAWAGMMLPVIALSHPGTGRLDRAQFYAALALGLGLLLIGKAITLAASAMLGLLLVLLWQRMPHAGLFALLRHRVVVWWLVGLAALLPLILISMPAVTAGAPSLEARRQTWSVMRSALEHESWIWLIGRGTGTVTDTIAQYLVGAGIPIWNPAISDFLWRNYFHLHNWLLQALHDGGLPAVLLLFWMMVQPLRLAEPARRGVAVGITIAYLLAAGLWFENIMSLVYIALAWAALVQTAEMPQPARQSPSGIVRRLPAAAAVAALAIAMIWGAVSLEQFSRDLDRHVAWFSAQQNDAGDPLPAAPPIPVDPRRTDKTMGEFVQQMMARLIDRHDHMPGYVPNTVRETQRIAEIIRIVETILPQTTSAHFVVLAERGLAEIMQRPSLARYRPDANSVLPLWRLAVEKGLILAPRRPDIALGYLNYTYEQGLYAQTRTVVQLLLRSNPDDPVGLFFSGALSNLQDDPAAKARAAEQMRRAVANGLETFFAIDDTFKRNIGLPTR